MRLTGFCGGRLQKALAVIGLLCLLLSFGAVTASAKSAAKITESSGTVERGDNVSVAFNLEGNPGIWGLKLRIQYDHSALTLQSVSAGSIFEKDEFVFSEKLDKDPYVVVASGNTLENKTANGTIVTLNFTVNSHAAFKEYPVTVEVAQANNVDGDKVSIGAGDGSVTVVDTVANPSESTGSTEPSTAQTVKPPEGNHPNTGDKSSAAPVIVIAMAALLAGGTAAFLGTKKRRGL